jgi:hypothetical protein
VLITPSAWGSQLTGYNHHHQLHASHHPFGDFPSATNNARPIQEGEVAAAHHRHGLEVEDEGLLKDLIVIFVFLGFFVLFGVSFNARVLFAKKK